MEFERQLRLDNLICFGYIREISSKNELIQPEEIVLIILKFYNISTYQLYKLPNLKNFSSKQFILNNIIKYEAFNSILIVLTSNNNFNFIW